MVQISVEVTSGGMRRSSREPPGWATVFFGGDEKLPSYIGIIINHYKGKGYIIREKDIL